MQLQRAENSCHCASYTLILKGLEFGTTRHLKCKYLMVTHGILAHQYTPAERGLDTSRFRGPVSLAGKDNGVDCVAGTQDLTGKVRLPATHCPVIGQPAWYDMFCSAKMSSKVLQQDSSTAGLDGHDYLGHQSAST